MPKSVLLVDDDHTIRNLLLQILSNMDLTIEVCEDGLKAFEKIKNNQYALLILDVMMPKLDGISLVNLLNEQNLTKHVAKIMLISGLKDDPAILELISQQLVHDYIVKTDITPDFFMMKIQQILGAHILTPPIKP